MSALLFVIWPVALAVFAQQNVQSVLPNELRVPTTEKLVLHAHGVGDQIYTCNAVEGRYVWVLKAPDAKLLDSDGRVLGRHFAGPTWEANDGSRLSAKPAASVPSPNADAIPWLRLIATQHEGAGTMSGVSTVQRLNTTGGKAPTVGCDNLHVGAETRAHYEADYFLYSAGK